MSADVNLRFTWWCRTMSWCYCVHIFTNMARHRVTSDQPQKMSSLHDDIINTLKIWCWKVAILFYFACWYHVSLSYIIHDVHPRSIHVRNPNIVLSTDDWPTSQGTSWVMNFKFVWKNHIKTKITLKLNLINQSSTKVQRLQEYHYKKLFNLSCATLSPPPHPPFEYLKPLPTSSLRFRRQCGRALWRSRRGGRWSRRASPATMIKSSAAHVRHVPIHLRYLLNAGLRSENS